MHDLAEELVTEFVVWGTELEMGNPAAPGCAYDEGGKGEGDDVPASIVQEKRVPTDRRLRGLRIAAPPMLRSRVRVVNDSVSRPGMRTKTGNSAVRRRCLRR